MKNDKLFQKVKILKDLLYEDDVNAQILDSLEIINEEELSSIDGNSLSEECITDNVMGVLSKPSMELNCQREDYSKNKWTMTQKFHYYQQCTSQGMRLVQKCPPNSIFWNILQCCVNIMDFPCLSNCIQPKESCIK